MNDPNSPPKRKKCMTKCCNKFVTNSFHVACDKCIEKVMKEYVHDGVFAEIRQERRWSW